MCHCHVCLEVDANLRHSRSDGKLSSHLLGHKRSYTRSALGNCLLEQLARVQVAPHDPAFVVGICRLIWYMLTQE